MIPRFWLEQKSIQIEIDWRDVVHWKRSKESISGKRDDVRRPTDESMAFFRVIYELSGEMPYARK